MLFSEPFESSKAMAGPVSKGVTKISKSTSNGTLKQGNRSVSFCLLTFFLFSIYIIWLVLCFWREPYQQRAQVKLRLSMI